MTSLKQKLKNLLIEFSTEKKEVVELKFVEAKLVDGTIVKQEGEELTIGQPVVVVTEEGEVPAPAGEHELESGEILVVEVNEEGVAVLTEIKEKVEEAEPEVEVEVEAETNFQITEEEVAGLVNLIENLQMEVGESKSEVAVLKGEFESLKTKVEELLGTPAVEPVQEQFSKSNLLFSSEKEERIERLKKISQLIK